MGVSNYNYLSKTDSGYTRYSRPTSTTVRKGPEGILRTKGRDREVIKCSSAITATTSYTSASYTSASSVYASSVRASSASFTLFVNQSQGATAAKLVQTSATSNLRKVLYYVPFGSSSL